jgi:hypothetical protein
MRATYFVQKEVSVYYKPILEVQHGRYGKYAVMNNFNYSEKKLLELGYELRAITQDEYNEIMGKYNDLVKKSNEEEYNKKIDERREQVSICLKATPVAIVDNEYYGTGATPVTHVSNIFGSGMENAYHGCGKGTAYVKDNFVVGFHYGYDRPPNWPRDCDTVQVEMSCGQLCFIGCPSKFKLFEENGKQVIERLIYPRFKGVVTMGVASDIENVEMIDNCMDPVVLARAIREAGEFLLSRTKNK